MRTPAIIVLLASASSLLGPCDQPTQPGPPSPGPGAPVYPHHSYTVTKLGDAGQAYYLYEPADPAPTSAPVTVFLHGYSGTDPQLYIAWIEHIVRRGSTVIYPVYQVGLDQPETYTPNAIAAVQAALAVLATPDHVAPDPAGLFYIGHSLGGVLATNLAAAAADSTLPLARSMLLANPGDGNAIFADIPSLITGDYAQIPAEMLFLAVTGADDQTAGDVTALHLYELLPQIPLDNREVIQLQSDYTGLPPVLATHFAALANPVHPPDALDYYGYWKFADALLDTVMLDAYREYAFGGTAEQLGLGQWSDGQPIAPAEVLR